jgi:periplasmic protein CpxP/Spy
MTRLAVLSALTLVFGVSAPAFAQGPGGGPRGHGHGGFATSPFMLRSLGLSDAQKAQVRQIMASHRPKFQALYGQLRDARAQLADTLVAPGTVQAADLTPRAQQISQIREQLSQEALQVALEIRGVLTPDQLAKAAGLHQRLKDLRSQMRQLLEGAGH